MNALLALLVVICSLNCIACLPYPSGIVSPRSRHVTEEPPFSHNPPHQSPIDIRTRQAVRRHLPDLRFVHPLSDSTAITLKNNGKGVDVVLANENTVKPRMLGGPLENVGQFAFSNLHFHWGPTDHLGSEHEFNGNRLAMEAHFVHFNSKYGTIEEAQNHADGLAVVAFLLMAGGMDNPEFERLVRLLPDVEYYEESVTVRARDLMSWVPEMWKPRGYFTYPGSLTTPTFAENVIWIVYPEPIHISSRQVQHFRQLRAKDGSVLINNSRAVQPLNDRTVIFAT